MNLVTLFSLLVLSIFLAAESFLHHQRLRKIPRRMAITGVRGKSSITRLVAAALREAGFRVVAKTTGSRPVLIHPDGREERIKRRGRASILEQKKLIRIAAGEKADFLVSEMMSIRPECLRAEYEYLLQPELLILSNFRPDHIEYLGQSREETARAMMSAIPSGSQVILPEEEVFPWLEAEAREKGVRILTAGRNSEAEKLLKVLPYPEFEPNLRLALAVLRHLGVSSEKIVPGWSRINPDFGHLRGWQIGAEDRFFISLFAANDPESSLEAMRLVLGKRGWTDKNCLGLLSLRGDRRDRSQQWADFLKGAESRFLDSIFLIGPGARAVERKIRKAWSAQGKKVWVIKKDSPEACLEEIKSLAAESQTESVGTKSGLVIFGLGNIVGFGQDLIDYLERTSDAIRI